jgi:hypothetical protein
MGPVVVGCTGDDGVGGGKMLKPQPLDQISKSVSE